MIQVYKFGGVSVQHADAIINVSEIIKKGNDIPTVIVLSAAGKTTNALEQVWERLIGEDREGALESLMLVKNYHEQIMQPLFEPGDEVYAHVNDLFVEIEWVIEDDLHPDIDYIYDQVISVGELISTRILAAYLQKAGMDAVWVDIRDVIRTDNTYRDAIIDWNFTRSAVNEIVKPLTDSGKKVVVQGFIGGTSENFTTTLGREGSDYTASVLANCLDAEKLIIWKDVPGIMTADPRLFKDVTLLETLSYREAIEMTYYGAKVLHPKSIKPIQNKNIPLFVRSFLHPDKPGTVIHDVEDVAMPPVVVVEREQCLLRIASPDFSFIAEHHLQQIFSIIAKHRLKVNLMRNSAISFTVCLQYVKDRYEACMQELGLHFNVSDHRNLEIITVRHYLNKLVDKLVEDKVLLMEERHHRTAQMVVQDVKLPQRKE